MSIPERAKWTKHPVRQWKTCCIFWIRWRMFSWDCSELWENRRWFSKALSFYHKIRCTFFQKPSEVKLAWDPLLSEERWAAAVQQHPRTACEMAIDAFGQGRWQDVNPGHVFDEDDSAGSWSTWREPHTDTARVRKPRAESRPSVHFARCSSQCVPVSCRRSSSPRPLPTITIKNMSPAAFNIKARRPRRCASVWFWSWGSVEWLPTREDRTTVAKY